MLYSDNLHDTEEGKPGSANMKNILETSPAADALLDLRCAVAPQLRALRDEVRGFCQSKLPDDIRAKVLLNQHLTKDDHLRWHRILHSGGLLVGHWPKEQGGRGWSRLERWVFENEIYRAGSPWLVPFGITYLRPVVFTFGNQAQKERWLPPTAESQIWWAQGYSRALHGPSRTPPDGTPIPGVVRQRTLATFCPHSGRVRSESGKRAFKGSALGAPQAHF